MKEKTETKLMMEIDDFRFWYFDKDKAENGLLITAGLTVGKDEISKEDAAKGLGLKVEALEFIMDSTDSLLQFQLRDDLKSLFEITKSLEARIEHLEKNTEA